MLYFAWMIKEKGVAKKTAKQFNVEIKPDAPLFVIGIVSVMTGVPIWTLRRLDDMGVVSPQRINKKIRCYSHTQIKEIVYIHHLMDERHVNMSGIKVILEIEKKK
jgi:MerR family transcriptional regulator, heat shock protein HspR